MYRFAFSAFSERIIPFEGMPSETHHIEEGVPLVFRMEPPKSSPVVQTNRSVASTPLLRPSIRIMDFTQTLGKRLFAFTPDEFSFAAH
jgi:hypothetical protein